MSHLQTSPDLNAGQTSSGGDILRIVSLLRGIITAIVGRPDEVSISARETDNEVIFTVKVADEDVGKVLGKQGRTARSLRTILGAVAAPMNRTYSLNIADTRQAPDN